MAPHPSPDLISDDTIWVDILLHTSVWTNGSHMIAFGGSSFYLFTCTEITQICFCG